MLRILATRPTRRVARLGTIASAICAMAVSLALIWHSSYAAWSATTNNPNNNWTAGSVTLTDDDSGAAMFTASPVLKPGQTVSHCITVTSNGTLPAAVRLYGTGYSTTNGLGSALNVTISQGTGGSFANCTGFTSGSTVYSGSTLDAFATADTSYSAGLTTWTTSGTAGDNRTFKFDITLDPNAASTTQNGTAQIAFVWEAQPI